MKDDQTITTSVEIFSRPVSATLLLSSMLFTRSFYPRAPLVIFDLNSILILIPLLRLVPKLIPEGFKKILYTMTFFLLLERVSGMIPEFAPLHRILLLLIDTMALIGLTWSVRSSVHHVHREGNNWFRIIISLSRLAILAILIFAISVISNIVGNVYFANLLTEGILFTLFLSLVLLTGVLVLDSIFAISLQSRFLQFLALARLHGEILRKSINRFLHFLAFTLWRVFTLKIFLILTPLINFFSDILGKRWIVGSMNISVGNILVFILAIYFSILISRFIRFILKEDVLPRLQLPSGVPDSISLLAHYTILGIGIFIALSAVGVEMSRFALLDGALGIGIGFGLQNLVNNFISDLILIFERPIKVGDTIEVGSLTRVEKRIGIRSSTIRTFDGSEVIVPNGNLITNELVNWTFSDQLRRI